MLMLIVVTLLVVQASAVLLVLAACAVAAASDRRAVRPYVPQSYELRPAQLRVATDYAVTRIRRPA